MNPICGTCGVEMSCKKTGRIVEMQTPGEPSEGGGKPLFRWQGDEFGCRGCGARVVVGMGRRIDAHEPAFAVFGEMADERGGALLLTE